MSGIEDITARGFGVDIQYRSRGFDSRAGSSESGRSWRVRIVADKNLRADYRVTAYGQTREEAENRLIALVEELDRQ